MAFGFSKVGCNSSSLPGSSDLVRLASSRAGGECFVLPPASHGQFMLKPWGVAFCRRSARVIVSDNELHCVHVFVQVGSAARACVLLAGAAAHGTAAGGPVLGVPGPHGRARRWP